MTEPSLTPEQFQRLLDAASERAMAAVGAGLYLVANNIMTKSKRVAPLDLGTLQRSGYVTLPQKVGGEVVIEIGFGGFAEKYAVPQHEDPRLRRKREPGRMWKYLYYPYLEAASTAAADACDFARAMFEGDKPLSLPPSSLPQDPWIESCMPIKAKQSRKAKKAERKEKMRLRKERQRVLAKAKKIETLERERERRAAARKRDRKNARLFKAAKHWRHK